MAGNKKKWDGALNPGGIIGGLACGAIVGIFVFANADSNNLPRWAAKAPIFAVIGGAYVGTVVWSRLFSKCNQQAAPVAAVHKQIIQRGAECPHCRLNHAEYRLLSSGKSLDEPCIICRSCGRSSAASDFVGAAIYDQNAA